MFEEKELNEQENIEVNTTNNYEESTINFENNFNPVMPENQSVSMPTQNAFLYMDTPVSQPIPSDEMNQSLDVPEQNVDVFVEQPMICKEVNVANEKKEPMDEDLKSNLVFMLIFAIIMLAIIIALPYVSGYN